MDDFSDYDVRLIPALRAQLAACVTARDEAARAYAERVRVLREALTAAKIDMMRAGLTVYADRCRAALEATK